MPIQQGSRTDWRYRVVTDTNWLRDSYWLLTDPGFNTTPGDQDFPAVVPGAHQLAGKYGIASRSQFEVTGSGVYLLSLDVPVIPPVWENPKVYQRSVELLTWIQARTEEYDAEEVKPFHQDEWPVPRGYEFPNANRGFVQGIPGAPFWEITLNPFFQTDWPVPRGYPFPTENRGFTQSTWQVLLGIPFAQLDWPVPRGYPFPTQNRGFVAGTHPLLLAVPFNQFDWPNPFKYAFDLKLPTENRGFVSGTPALLRAVPFAQLDWPVPKGYPYPISLRFLGPQLLHYIYERAGFGTISDALADGFRLFDMLADGGTLSDAFADGWRISDAYADGATIEDELSNGGRLTDGR